MKAPAKSASSTAKKTTPASELEELKKQKAALEKNLQEMAQLQEESRAIQEELERSHERNEQILEQAVDSVVTINADKIITFYNKAAETMFGYAREEVLGQNVKMIVPMEHRGNHDQYVDSNMKTSVNKVVGKGRDLEMVRKDGSTFWGNLSLSKVEVGGRLQYTAFIKNITEDRENKEKAQQMQAAVNTGFAAIEFLPDGTILTANANFCKTMEYSEESEIVGKHHRMFCDPAYTNSAEYANFWTALAQGNVNTGEFERVTKEGKRVWLNASYTPVKDADGHIRKVTKIATDITDMVAARLQGESVKAAVDTGWAFIEFDPDGIIVSVNRNFLSVLGYSEEKEVVGQHHQIFCEEEYARSGAYKKFWSDLAAGQIQSGEFKRQTRTGEEVWINASYTPIKDFNGNVVKVIKIATDISALKTPILQVRDIIASMAQGDLTRQFDMTAEGYVQEMGDALNVAIENLNALLGSIGKNADLVADSSSGVLEKSEGAKNNTAEVASAIAQMAKGAQDQALKTDESSKLVEQVKASSSDMEEKANSIYRTAEKGQQRCENGLKTIKNLISNMGGINDSATVTSESISILTQRAEEIGRTLKVITDIAAQTNLLALNAAIEAARAGDAGRGFAVVAEEIRKLAEDSRRSAIDIEKIIGDVQKDTQSASKAIDTMSSSVKDGSAATQEASEIFEEIAQASSDTLNFSKEIQQATSAQKASIDTVAKNIEQIVVVAEETAAGSEEVASSSQQLNSSMKDITEASNILSGVADDLQKGIRQFRLRDNAL